MVSKNPEQRQFYDARLKYQRDQAMFAQDASRQIESARKEGLEQGIEKGRAEGRDEGLREGIEKGELLGQIKLLQNLLDVSQPTSEELSSFNEGQLSELVDQLKRQLRTRGT